MELSVGTVLLVVSGGSAVATAIFWGAFYLGRIWNRLDEHDRRLDNHEQQIAELRG